jgi:DNA end-binding protein Ku
MARALWTGSLTFGLVNVPVEVHTAVRDVRPKFHLLRSSDRSRIHLQRVSEKDGQVVDWDDIVRGFEYEKGRYIVLTPKELERAAVKRDRSIDILDFVDTDAIDDRYFEKPYYLTPGKGGAHAYALLREAIRKSGRVGVGKFVLRSKEHLVAIEAIKDALVLSTMRFREELVELKDFAFPAAKGVRGKDLDLATRLIDEFAAEWDPDKYTDDYQHNLMELIKAKQKHAKPSLEAQSSDKSADVIDLMERLRRSLGSRGGKSSARATKATTRRRSASARKTGAKKSRRSHHRAA